MLLFTAPTQGLLRFISNVKCILGLENHMCSFGFPRFAFPEETQRACDIKKGKRLCVGGWTVVVCSATDTEL